MINKELVEEWLRYEPETGDFYWRKNRSSTARAGQKTGYRNKLGYIQIGLAGKIHLAHRLAFLVTHGYFPKYIDHINGNPSDNRIENLRECSQGQNLANTKKPHNNRSGVKNVAWHKQSQSWHVRVWKNGKQNSFGYYKNLDEAAQVAREARVKIHGKFARHE